MSASESALDLRKQQKFGAARAKLVICATSSCPAEVREECERRIGELNGVQPTIVLEAKDGAGKDLTSVRVLLDGEPLAETLDGRALSVDPGKHTLRFELEGVDALEEPIVVREGEKARIVRVVLGAGAESPAPPGTVQAPGPDTGAEPEPEAGSDGSTQRTIALIVGGVGIVGIGVGSYFGLSASSKWSDAQDECGDGCSSGSSAHDKRDEAESAATLSTVSFAVGGAALVGAAVLWLTAPSAAEPSSARVSVGPSARGVGVSLNGAF